MKPGIEFIVIANRNEDRFRINIDFKCFLPAAVGNMTSEAEPIFAGVLALDAGLLRRDVLRQVLLHPALQVRAPGQRVDGKARSGEQLRKFCIVVHGRLFAGPGAALGHPDAALTI